VKKRFGSLWTIFFFFVRLLVLFVCLLVDCRHHSERCCVEDSSFVSFVVSMEENK
jgi:hypothetical protein